MAEARSIHSFFLTAPNQHRPFCDLAGRTAQPCPSPALWCAPPHPLQNRVPRVQVLLPLPKTGENTGFSPVFFLPVLHGNGVHFGSNSGFSHPFAPALNRPHPLQHPKRTRFRLFRAFSRCAFLFSVVFGLQNFPAVFMYPAL